MRKKNRSEDSLRVSNMFSRGDQTSDPFPSYLNLQPRFGFIATPVPYLFTLLEHFIVPHTGNKVCTWQGLQSHGGTIFISFLEKLTQQFTQIAEPDETKLEKKQGSMASLLVISLLEIKQPSRRPWFRFPTVTIALNCSQTWWRVCSSHKVSIQQMNSER